MGGTPLFTGVHAPSPHDFFTTSTRFETAILGSQLHFKLSLLAEMGHSPNPIWEEVIKAAAFTMKLRHT